jgi:SprT protein
VDLSSFLTDSTIKKINSWEEQFNVKVIITKPSQSRLGVFIPKRFENHVIRINNNMNEYAFLITLIHEMAHASIWEKYGRKVTPHGIEWKKEFQKMMLPFLNPNFFPEKILKPLSFHMINPKSSTIRDVELSKIINTFDDKDIIFISDLKDGDEFRIRNGKKFRRIEKLRKNYKCIEVNTSKLYRFSPLAEVKPL